MPTYGTVLKPTPEQARRELDTAARQVTIKPPNFGTATFELVGDAPLVVHRFSAKVKRERRLAMCDESKALMEFSDELYEGLDRQRHEEEPECQEWQEWIEAHTRLDREISSGECEVSDEERN